MNYDQRQKLILFFRFADINVAFEFHVSKDRHIDEH